MWQNMGREIQLKRREMAFPWISVGGNDMVRRDWGMLQNAAKLVEENPVEMPWNDVFVDFSRRKWREAEELGAIRPCSS